MNPDLRELLICAGAGLALGIFLARTRPDWCKTWTKFCLNGQWKLFAVAAAFFGAGGALLAVEGSLLHSAVSFALCALEIYALLRFGLKPLTPEQAQQIDESDPARFWRWKPGRRS